MLEPVSVLRHFSIHAVDGDLGHVTDVLFDDQTWTARYLVVETGGWLRRRRVLISPIAVVGLDEGARTLSVDLTRGQIAGSPSVDTDAPLSRQMELKYRDYFSWPLYWVETYLGAYNGSLFPGLAAADREIVAGRRTRRESLLPDAPRSDLHLRSAACITGYTVIALDGIAGRLEDFVIDTDRWVLRALTIRPGHADRPGAGAVSLPIARVVQISWAASAVRVRAWRHDLRDEPRRRLACA